MDRNFESKNAVLPLFESPPARVAWIETSDSVSYCQILSVATREGGVDRNVKYDYSRYGYTRRHPRGWRG